MIVVMVVTLLAGCNTEIGTDNDTTIIVQAQLPEPTPEILPIPIPQSTLEPTSHPHVFPSAVPHNVVSVSSCAFLTTAITEDGTLWSWGGGTCGSNFNGVHDWQIPVGDGSIYMRYSPVPILPNVVSVAVNGAGYLYSLAITEDGTLWGWGGFWDIDKRNYYPIPLMQNVAHARATAQRYFVITTDNELLAWGNNGVRWYGTPSFLGDGATENSYSPVLIMENVLYIFPTASGAYVVTQDNVLWGWGANSYGHFGEDTETYQIYPMQLMENVATVLCIIYDRTLVLSTGGELLLMGSELELLMEDVLYATRSYNNFFAITTDGVLWAWGDNQLPLPSLEYRGERWAVEPVWTPLLGDGTTIDRDTPVRIMDNAAYIHIAADTAFAITHEGTLWAWGSNHMGQLGVGTTGTSGGWWDEIEFSNAHLLPVRVMDNIVSISSTYVLAMGYWLNIMNTFVITAEGELWAWGGGYIAVGIHLHALLGDGTNDIHISPVRIF